MKYIMWVICHALYGLCYVVRLPSLHINNLGFLFLASNKIAEWALTVNEKYNLNIGEEV